jgi:NTE family protein
MDITNKINGINKNINETFENFFYDSIDDHFVIDKIPIYKSKKKKKNKKKKFEKKKILLFSGGGIKGLVYPGVIKALEELEILKNIEIYVGTSIGSLVITMLLLGYSSLEMEHFLLNFDLSSLKSIDFLIFLKEYGLDRGEKMEYLVKRLLLAKGLSEDITLIDLFNITGVEFIITTVNLNELKTVYLSYKTNPNLKLVTAIRMSISIPFFYTPVKYNNKYYIDGACMDNYPISLFTDRLDETIGFFICSSSKKVIDNFENIESYIFRVLCSLCEGNDYNCIRAYHNNTICLKLNNISMLDFKISNERIKEIINYGYKETLKNIT